MTATKRSRIFSSASWRRSRTTQRPATITSRTGLAPAMPPEITQASSAVRSVWPRRAGASGSRTTRSGRRPGGGGAPGRARAGGRPRGGAAGARGVEQDAAGTLGGLLPGRDDHVALPVVQALAVLEHAQLVGHRDERVGVAADAEASPVA